MPVYLVRHATALPAEKDPQRGLSEEGRKEAEKVAVFLKGKITLEAIYHSPKKRAKETALVFAESLEPSAVEEAEGLLPNDEPELWLTDLTEEHRSVMLVGHLPHMEVLAQRLLSVRKDGGRIKFSPASVMCLEKLEGVFALKWFVEPDIL